MKVGLIQQQNSADRAANITKLQQRIRQAAALRFRLLTGGGFTPDEWREAPRLINRLDAGSVVLYRGQPVAVPAVPGHLRFP